MVNDAVYLFLQEVVFAFVCLSVSRITKKMSKNFDEFLEGMELATTG